MTQKPIAYINVEKRTLEFAEPIKWHTPTVANLDRIPLFTQRTWVGLNKEEAFELQVKHKDKPFSLSAAVENLLREKNQ
jgi:hypothetical protein